MSASIETYLQKRAEPGPWVLIRDPGRRTFPYIITIPAHDELDFLPATLASLDDQDSQLLSDLMVIVIVNQSKDAPSGISGRNRKLLTGLAESRHPFYLNWVDASSPNLELPARNAGAGLARKIGMDRGLAYAAEDTLMFCLDADSPVAPNYLQNTAGYFRDHLNAAAVLGFQHSPADDDDIERAIREYEHFLIDTAERLTKAGSPYGYPAVGSTIVCTASAYSAVGGMPRNAAGEDFYFLQALAKYRPVHWIRETVVFPSPRFSTRVHLGTGTRMREVRNGFDIRTLYYPQAAFILLEKWLQLGTSGWTMDLGSLLKECDRIDGRLKAYILSEKIERSWAGLVSSSPTEKHFQRQFHRWFDGLKTMRFLKHYSA